MGAEDDQALRPRRLSQDRERAIIDATLELLAELGYDRMSVDEIARRAGASKATIYRRWSGKSELVVDVICRRFDPDTAEPPDTGTLRGDLVAVFAAFCRALERKHDLIVGLLPTLLSDLELANTLRAHLPSQDLSGVSILLDRARERGDLPSPVDPAEILPVAEALAYRRVFFTGRPLDDAFTTHSVDRVLLPLIHTWSS
ncbi:TetR/AcrR family transcriptional regulator [Sphaerisporangium corydalis]|uniref:TetR/AcrR family transcriptional regulator n=1 Tax=Sphaerisporangium corydalis TaxID=1441875 RepID=A0ABV9ET22_9ACTN|nr:TetR/AcrR family transcriptional regulator [Sphaerisporangium corydalis]